MDSYRQNNNKPHKPNSNSSTYKHEASSPTDLLSSAQVLGEAAMSTFRREKGKVDTSEAAVAADNLLHAVSQYGHLEEKSFGKYLETAEGYLHKYAAPQQTSSNQSKPSKFNKQQEYEDEEGYEEERPKITKHQKQQKYKEEEEYEEERPTHPTGKVKKQQKEEYEEEQTGGIGNYMKMAQGFMKKQDGGHSGNSTSEGGIGEYMKLAQGFLGKR